MSNLAGTFTKGFNSDTGSGMLRNIMGRIVGISRGVAAGPAALVSRTAFVVTAG